MKESNTFLDARSTLDIGCVCSDPALLPSYGSQLASGVDFRACLTEDIHIMPGDVACIPTGISLSIPEGFELQIRPRSGLALKSGVTVLNSPGTIDADYTGEIKIILINHSKKTFIITPGMRIAQGVFAPIVRVTFILQESLEPTARGAGGFGSTGTH